MGSLLILGCFGRLVNRYGAKLLNFHYENGGMPQPQHCR